MNHMPLWFFQGGIFYRSFASDSKSGGVAQLVRACGSYPQCPGFKSLHRHQFRKKSWQFQQVGCSTENLFSILRTQCAHPERGFFLSGYLLLTTRGFFFRMRVPRSLQPFFGKRELKKSHRTSDVRTPERLAAQCALRAFMPKQIFTWAFP